MKNQNFASLSLSPDLLAVISEVGYETMTPIQAGAIPLLLEGKDLIGQSKTGSGKTAAFALPILEKLNLDSPYIQALILCPTRELCAQVAREIRRLGRRHRGLQTLIVCGGEPSRPQITALQSGVHIVVGTPGRVLDLIGRRRMDLNFLDTLVLDEADRMLEMGFEEDMQAIMDEAPSSRQTVLFSATYPPTIKALSRKYQHHPTMVIIENAAGSSPAIQALFCEIDRSDKLNILMGIAKRVIEYSGKALVFCNHKATVAEISSEISAHGVKVDALHGDLEQNDRAKAMAKFRNGSTQFLIATDVAARGLDIVDLDLVINFDFPNQADTYLHRIGRTGRAGKSGLAISLVTPKEHTKLSEYEMIYKASGATNAHSKQIRPSELLDIKYFKAFGTSKSKSSMLTFVIGGGRKEKVRPGDILGALTGEAGGFSAKDIGVIEIHDHHSFVAISEKIGDEALKKLRQGRIKGHKFSVKLMS
jgi:ATP-independent RNA helicase DbpA